MGQIRNQPVQERSRQTLDAILDAADCLFQQKGVAEASLTEIADLAHCSIGSLYRFFPNKEALVAEYVDRYGALLATDMPALPRTVELDTVADIVDILVDRSVAAFFSRRGYEHVRSWRYKDGRPASEKIREAEFALFRKLLSETPYDLKPETIDPMVSVIVDGTWPLITGLAKLPEQERPKMISEIKFFIANYVRSRIRVAIQDAQTPSRPNTPHYDSQR